MLRIGEGLKENPATYPTGQQGLGLELKNYATGSVLVDTLHQRSTKINCRGNACLGALMRGQSTSSGHLTKDELKDEAEKYLKEYTSLNKLTDEDFQQRLNHVKDEIEKTGTYVLTQKELLYGAKLAWRNAQRCPARIHWQKIALQDCRYATSTEDMFQALCAHLQYATNNGNIRSTITIFPPRIAGREDWRIWNSQLIGFACYKSQDGTLVGDPKNLDFTEICQNLGWEGKGGQFDVLPWILSAPVEGAKLYTIPEEYLLMVDLEHPTIASFREMNLKWHAVPFISDMVLEIGGIFFTAAPFNGWYSVPEIGMRNLCDPQRYNILEKIAKQMQIDTSALTWKDTATDQINRAVLHSFQKSNVTIVDHYTLAESFMVHYETEFKKRGGCPADFVWISTSGSSCPVFHQEMITYNLKPEFNYQSKPWLEAQLKPACLTLAKDPSESQNSMLDVRATILFASESGKSETFAKRLGKILNISFDTSVICMEDYNIEDLETETFVLMVASTFGSGEPPGNGEKFWASLQQLKTENKQLTGLQYAVFALGSSQYKTFCNFGKNLDSCMQDLGATRVLSLEKGDEKNGQEDTFNKWLSTIYDTSCEVFNVVHQSENAPGSGAYEGIRESLRFVTSDKKNSNVLKDLSLLHNKELISLQMLSSTVLQADSDRETFLIRLKAKDASVLNYRPGDRIGIFPSNPEHIVNDILQRCNYDCNEMLQAEYLKDGTWVWYDQYPIANLKTYLSKYLDITSVPSRNFLRWLSTAATSEKEIYFLKRLLEVPEVFEEWKKFSWPHLAELLQMFQSVQVDPVQLIPELCLLKPRFYSINSSQSATPAEVHVTVSMVSYKTEDTKGPTHDGVCSSYLKNLKPNEEVPCFIKSAPNFHLPQNVSDPIIMVAAGSGIAPFRSFWTERKIEMKKQEVYSNEERLFGPMYLFFGCRTFYTSLYEREISDMVNRRVISKIFMAYSREPDCEKEYVQHKLLKEADLVFDVLAGKGHIYVCGDAVMATGVSNMVQDILTSRSGTETTFNELLESGRYHEDIFNILHGV